MLDPLSDLTGKIALVTGGSRRSLGHQLGHVRTAALYLASPSSSFTDGALARVNGGLPIKR